MQGMDAAQEGKLIQVPTRGTGQAVKGDQHYVMEGMDAAKEGKMIKAQSSKFIETVKDQSQEPPKWISSPGKRKRMGRKPSRGSGPKKISKEWIEWKKHDLETGGSYKTGGPIKAAKSKWIVKKGSKTIPGGQPDTWDKSIKHFRSVYDLANELKTEDRLTAADLENARKIIKSRKNLKQGIEYTDQILRMPDELKGKKTGGVIKAKKGIWTGAATSMYDKPPGWDVKKISDKTHKKLTKLWKHREAGGWSPAAGKEYREHLKGLKKLTTKTKVPSTFLERRKQLSSFSLNKKFNWKAANKSLPFVKKSKSFYFKDLPKDSKFLERRLTLGGARTLLPSPKILAVLKKVARKTAIGKGIAAATVVAGAYEAGKRKLFTKDKDKKKVTKKSIGGETVIMKSGGGYIDDLV